MIGTIFIDRYRIEGNLGQGGMGVVYRAHDLLLERDVALKVLVKSGLGTEGRAHLLREAKAAAQLNHPNIVTVYDAGESDNLPFIVMELVEGNSLHEKRPVDFSDILAIAKQICAALEHAHTHAIVHRDLKPENVLVTAEGHAKLTDFGLARSVASRLTAEGTIAGSVFYLAPELAMGHSFDGRADLYALGVILYELTAGELPYSANDPLAIIAQHLYAPVVPPRALNDQIPPALDSLILRLMSKRADDRPGSAGEVIKLLERIEAGEGEPLASAKLSPLDRIVRGRLVGRERELADAYGSWNKAMAGESMVLLISGEPGIGKSRLAFELIVQAQVRGAYVLMGDCYVEGCTPYGPAAQIIETASNLYTIDHLASLPDLLSLAPGLRGRYPDVLPESTLEPQAEQQRMYESLVDLIAALSNQAPVLLMVEDAHWADSGTLSLLRHLARRAAKLKLRLLILLTYREEELDEARSLNQVLYDFTRERLAARIKLGRLDRDQSGELLGAILGEEITPEFLNGIYRETEGNPFFIEEVCKALVEQGKLYRDNGHWRWPRMEEIEIPQSIKVAIQTRLSKLPLPAHETLRTASIIGREFDFETLKEVSDLDEDVLLEALESAERAQLVNEVRHPGKPRAAASTTFAFAHALIASTLRESISGLRRQRLHQRAAIALENLKTDQLDELAPQLGRHFAEAGEWDKAAKYLLRAGDQARQLYAYQEAIENYRQALAILRDQNNFERAARTLMKLGLLYHATFDFQRSRQAYQEGFALWQQAGERLTVSLPAAPHALRIGWKQPMTLDPSLAYETSSAPIIDQLFVGLVSLTPDMDVSPELAKSWEVLENGRKYIFNLREDATWTDGTPVTAHDFEFAWKRVLDPATRSRNPILFYDILGARDFHQGRVSSPDKVGVRALDAFTLVVELEQPTGYFLHLLTYTATFAVPRHVVEAKGLAWTEAENIVTNGPFRLEERKDGESWVLTRNPGYRGRFGGNVHRVEISLNPEFNKFAVRLAAYKAGQLDVCGLGGSPSESDRARQIHAGEYISLPSANVNFLIFDVDRPPFDDPRVRRAFVHAVDRETLAEAYLRGYVHPATGGMVPPGFPGHSAEIGLPFAPDQARRLIAEAGYPHGQGFPLVEVWLPTPETYQEVEYIQDHWLEYLGVESRWISMEGDILYKRLETEMPHIFWNGWLADYPDPDNFLRVGVAYQSRWHHPVYDQLVENARRVTNQAERMKMYQEAERILIQEAALMPLFYGRSHLLMQPWVRRYPMSPIQPLILKDVFIEPHEEG